MKFLNLFNLFIFISSFYLIQSDITIIGPDDLSSKFQNNIIPMTYDKIGKSNYDFYTRGQLFIEENNLEACQRTTLPKNLDNSQFNEGFRILITKRGGCSFVYKARNAQYGGFAMIIVVNNMDTDIKKIIMTDDGSGNDIYIPIAMISKDDGEKIINYLTENKNSKVSVEINFIKKPNKFKSLDVKFFFSSSNLRAYELFNNLAQYMNKFGDQVNFTPIYVVHRAL